VRIDAMEHYKLVRDFRHAGFFETEQHRRLFRQIKSDIRKGAVIAVSGMIGSGKTVTLRKLREALIKEGKIFVARSLMVEKEKVHVRALISALFYDLQRTDKVFIPAQGEQRERLLIELIRQERKPVVLIVDEAHDLPLQTLKDIKRVLEVVNDSGATLSVLLAGHPKLTNDLKRMNMQEIGPRTSIHSLDGAIDSRRQYIEWLLTECAQDAVMPLDLIESEAIDLLAEKLVTPLQIEQHLALAFEAGHDANEMPVSAEVVSTILSNAIGNLEATLTRLGYDNKAIGGLLNVSPAEVRQFVAGHLDAARSQEFHEQLLAVGLPI
jgi:type II secretory pathway predicted ATPase ExeA